MKYIALLLSLIALYFVLCLIPSCSSNHPEGKYLMIKKGYYSQFDFKDDKTVIIVDNLGYGLSFSTTYKIFDNKVYIKTDKNDLVFDIQNDLLLPSDENGIYKEFVGTFAKNGSKSYVDALNTFKTEKKANFSQQQITNDPLTDSANAYNQAKAIQDSIENYEYETGEANYHAENDSE